MKDPSGAYGVYSYLRTPDMARANFTDHSSISGERALVLVGNLVLDVSRTTTSRSLQPDLRRWSRRFGRTPRKDRCRRSGSTCPRRNMVERTDRYILGPQTLNQLFPGGIGRFGRISKRQRKRNSRTTTSTGRTRRC